MQTLDDLRKDLAFQLSAPYDLDWDYFLETAEMAKKKADKENRNYNINYLNRLANE